MGVVRAAAYAKINLTLDILGRRPDGYHELASVMQSIDLHDDIQLDMGAQGISLVVRGDEAVPQDSRNIAWQAARAFFSEIARQPNVRITLIKRIPSSAGLGGGSADAAAVLVALNHYYEHPLSVRQLRVVGAQLGADVPFCIEGGTWLAEGIGERLTSLPAMPRYRLLLAKPDAAVSTQEVYRALVPDCFGNHFTGIFLHELRQNHPDLALDHLGNALESVTLDKIPQCQWWKDAWRQHGAAAQLMSGSGPTVFGIFTDEERAQRAWDEIHHLGQVYRSRLHHRGVAIIDENIGGC